MKYFLIVYEYGQNTEGQPVGEYEKTSLSL